MPSYNESSNKVDPISPLSFHLPSKIYTSKVGLLRTKIFFVDFEKLLEAILFYFIFSFGEIKVIRFWWRGRLLGNRESLNSSIY